MHFEPVLDKLPFQDLRPMHKSTHLIRVTFWFLSKPGYMTGSKTSYEGHLPNKQKSSTNYQQYPQGITDKLCLIYQRCEHSQMALSTHVKVMRLTYSSKTTSSCPLNLLISTPKRSKRCLETFPPSKVGIKMASLFSPHFWLHFWEVKIFLSHLAIIRLVIKISLSSLHLAYQLDGYLCPINLS